MLHVYIIIGFLHNLIMKKLLNYHAHWGSSKTSNLLWLDHVDSQFTNRSTSTGSHVLCNKFEEIFWFHLYEEIQSMVYIGLRKLWKTSFPCPYTILPFDLSPRLMTIRAVLMIFRRRHLTLNEIFVQVFLFIKNMWVSRAFTMRNLNSIFLNFSKSADVRRSIKKRAMTGILVQSRGC